MIFALSLVASPAPVYNLVARFKVGEQHRYKVQTAIAGMVDHRAVPIDFILSTKVLKAGPQGTTIKLTFSNFTSGKLDLPTLYAPTEVTLDKSNKPVGSSHGGEVFVTLPNRAVGLGDTWSGLTNMMAQGKSGANVLTSFKLTGATSQAGRSTASLSMNIRGTTPGEGTATVDMADGALLHEVMNVTVPDKARGTKFPVRILIDRQS